MKRTCFKYHDDSIISVLVLSIAMKALSAPNTSREAFCTVKSFVVLM